MSSTSSKPLSVGIPVPQLHVKVERLDSATVDLLGALPPEGNLAVWLGPGLNMVGWDPVVQQEFTGARAMREAARFWDEVREKAIVEGDPDLPVRFPLAFASFGFSSATTGYLLVPETVLVQIEGAIWAVTSAVGQAPKRFVPSDVAGRDPVQVPTGLWTEPGRMTRGKWQETVNQLVQMLQSGTASKVVLARDIVVSATDPIDERFLIKQLHDRYPTTWVYAVEGLVGATPEMLASLKKGRFISRVLAGTAAPGEGASLLTSIKNRTEHHLAVESVARALASLTQELTVPTEPELLDLPNVTHLSTDVEANIVDGNVLDLVDALHPTAAVCGTPTSLAFSILEDIEGTQRGRYSGPVGWIDGNGDGEFGIALRCGQLTPERTQIRVFAGGGIMPDSVAELELAETQAKMRPLLEALGVEK